MRSALYWLGERVRDLRRWPRTLLSALPRRMVRLAQAAGGRTPDDGERLRQGDQLPPLPARLHRLAAALFDLLGGPEALQFVMHLGMQTSPLSQAEVAALANVLGPQAIAYEQVRVAEGGVLALVFRWNGGRAFATWHTIHLPPGQRTDRSLLVHEAVHVYQYEQVGSAYIGEALYAQWRLGRACYDYGGEEGLARGYAYRGFNREAQAQIVQDYYRRRQQGNSVDVYLPYLSALRQAAF